jgi:hypothetical protein
MIIEIRAAEVYALATRLVGGADCAEEAAVHLVPPGRTGEALQAAAEAFLADHHRAAGALAGELRILAGRLTAVADSWLHVDGELLEAGGRAALR